MEAASHFSVLIMITGVVIVLTMLVKALLDTTVFPPLVGFLCLGFLVRTADLQWGLLTHDGERIFDFLGKVGLITLLFLVGLESKIVQLLHQLRRAAYVWFSGVTVSGLIGFAAAYYLLGLGLITSLITAAAFTATSLGVSVTVWQEADALKTSNGSLLIDTAELDDISAVVLMALLFTVLPLIREGGDDSIARTIAAVSGIFAVKLVGFGVFCYLFSRFIEPSMTERIRSLESPPDFMLFIAGVGVMIAAAAALLGFSFAIGAFFAGLVFSRDPCVLKAEGNFFPVYELFTPFFFIGIGMDMDPPAFQSALGVGAVLFVAAVFAKIIAHGAPVALMRGASAGLLIGVSMVPRAEITMVIMQRGLKLGEWAVPPHVYGGMVTVCAATCLASPVVVQSLLKKWPQKEDQEAQAAHENA